MSEDALREERDFSAKEPEFGPEIPPGVARECLEAWRGGRPWTQIRVLERGTDNPSDQTCGGSQGEFGLPCSGPVEAVQYSSRFGDPLFSCEEHALKQNGWDITLYDTRPEADRPEMPAEDRKLVNKILGKGKKQKEPEQEEELDL